MGLTQAVCGRKATFNIYCSTNSKKNLIIEIIGPDNSYCNYKIAIHSALTQVKMRSPLEQEMANQIEKCKNYIEIPFGYEISSDQICVTIAITYIPIKKGKYKLNIVWQGQHILGSPYNVIVDEALYLKNFHNMENMKNIVKMKNVINRRVLKVKKEVISNVNEPIIRTRKICSIMNMPLLGNSISENNETSTDFHNETSNQQETIDQSQDPLNNRQMRILQLRKLQLRKEIDKHDNSFERKIINESESKEFNKEFNDKEVKKSILKQNQIMIKDDVKKDQISIDTKPLKRNSFHPVSNLIEKWENLKFKNHLNEINIKSNKINTTFKLVEKRKKIFEDDKEKPTNENLKNFKLVDKELPSHFTIKEKQKFWENFSSPKNSNFKKIKSNHGKIFY